MSLKKEYPSLYNYNVLKIEKVVDGDTIYATVDTGFNQRYFAKVRLRDIDTPELNSSDPVERAKAMEMKYFVYDLLIDQRSSYKYLFLNSTSVGKYGRFIGDFMMIGHDGTQKSLVAEIAEYLKVVEEKYSKGSK